MKPRAAKSRFLARIKAVGHSPDDLTPAAGLTTMLAFYAEERAEGCDLDGEGDMLLLQWGVNDWGDGPAFELNITRQFMLADDNDDELWQLALTFRFEPSAALKKFKPGNRWCESPEALAAFRQFIGRSPAVRAVADQAPAGVELRFVRT